METATEKKKYNYTVKTGRPPIFASPEEIQIKVDEYFEQTPDNEYTITGLALHCGFSSLDTFYEYGKRGEFTEIIKKAQLRVANCYEKKLNGRYVIGAIFALKNMGWSDTQDITHRYDLEDLNKYSDDDLKKAVGKLVKTVSN